MTLIRRAILALALIAGIAPAFAQAPGPVPALPDTERRTSYSISASTCACAVGFQLYGDSTDVANWLEVFVNGAAVTGWAITSPTGPLSSIPRPITDAVLTFTAAQTGTVQIVGARRPRRTSQVSENRGVAARDFNQAITDIIATQRELWDKTNDFTGRGVFAPPGETLKLLPSLSARANTGACFDNGGNLTSCAAVPIPLVVTGGRSILVGDTTFYADIVVGTDVAGCGLAPGLGACRNIQYFVNILQGSYDLRQHQALIQLANSTSPAYASVLITGKWVGGNNVVIQGNTATPGSVVIDGGGGGSCVEADGGAVITLQGVKLQNCSLMLVSNIQGSQVYFQQVEFGAPVTGGVSIYCTRQSYCEVIGGGNLISGLGANFLQSSHQGNFRAAAGVAQPFTLTADLTVSGGGAFAYASSGADITFTGYTASAFNLNGHTLTGQRWTADSGGMIQLLNASTGKSMSPTFFPGNSGGSCTGDCFVDQSGHSGTAASSCGSGAGAAGTDLYGQVIEGSGSPTGCTITFGAAFSITPTCFISWFSVPPANVAYTTSTTGIVMTHSAGNGTFYYQCKGA